MDERRAMLITREVDYAVRILRVLSKGAVVSVQEICRRENISTAMAYKITRKLEKAGVIQSYRGASGGYGLDRELHELTLYDIVQIVDKELFLTQCLRDSYQCTQNTEESPCRVHREFGRLQQVLKTEMTRKTLAEIL